MHDTVVTHCWPDMPHHLSLSLSLSLIHSLLRLQWVLIFCPEFVYGTIEKVQYRQCVWSLAFKRTLASYLELHCPLL